MEELKVFDVDKRVLQDSKFANVKTIRGDIVIELYGDVAPQSVMNFVTLANNGFYKNLKFHRVIKNFVAQGGCPFSRDNPMLSGMGNPGYRIKCETENNPYKHVRGSLSMAHAGKDTGGSQFFICFVDLPHLDGVHTIFGAINKKDDNSFRVLDNIVESDVIHDILITDSIA